MSRLILSALVLCLFAPSLPAQSDGTEDILKQANREKSMVATLTAEAWAKQPGVHVK